MSNIEMIDHGCLSLVQSRHVSGRQGIQLAQIGMDTTKASKLYKRTTETIYSVYCQ